VRVAIAGDSRRGKERLNKSWLGEKKRLQECKKTAISRGKSIGLQTSREGKEGEAQLPRECGVFVREKAQYHEGVLSPMGLKTAYSSGCGSSHEKEDPGGGKIG